MSCRRTGAEVFLTAFLPVSTEPQPASASAPPASAVPVPVKSARREDARPSAHHQTVESRFSISSTGRV